MRLRITAATAAIALLSLTACGTTVTVCGVSSNGAVCFGEDAAGILYTPSLLAAAAPSTLMVSSTTLLEV